MAKTQPLAVLDFDELIFPLVILNTWRDNKGILSCAEFVDSMLDMLADMETMLVLVLVDHHWLVDACREEVLNTTDTTYSTREAATFEAKHQLAIRNQAWCDD